MPTRTRTSKQTLTRKSSPTRRTAKLRGLKGGVSTVQNIQKDIQKEAPQIFQKYADKALKTANKMGLKGGAAVVAGSAAGVVVGAALGGMAAAAMSSMRTARLTNNTRSAAESIKRHADDLEKFAGKKEHDN